MYNKKYNWKVICITNTKQKVIEIKKRIRRKNPKKTPNQNYP